MNAAGHLTDNGKFLLEVFVPDLGRFDRGQRVSATEIKDNQVKIDISKHDMLTQQVSSQHVVFSEEGIKLYPVVVRYAWPSELDMMARVAGLRLVDIAHPRF